MAESRPGCLAPILRSRLTAPRARRCHVRPGVQPGGHGGSHGYLGDDFIDAILRGRKPAVDVIDALNMTVPGYYAHLSAMKGGETLKVPQFLPAKAGA